MNFSKLLSKHIGENIEIFFSNEFIQGKLKSTNNGFFTVKVADPSYTQPFKDISVSNNSVEYVRVIG